MRSPTVMTLGLLATMTLTLAPATADHIPGHDPSDPVFPVPLPGSDVFSGGAAWLHAIGPPGGAEIFNAQFDITYVSDGATPASELSLNVGWNVMLPGGTTEYVEIIVTGADLGFGSGPGTFKGTFETTALNGIAIEFFLTPPYSTMDVIIGAVNGGIEGTGFFVDSFINFSLLPASAPSFCDDADGSLASCRCAPGAPDTGCDIPQGTGGVGLTVLAHTTSPNGATLQGTGFPTMSSPTAIVIRSSLPNLGAPVVFGDGIRCIDDASGLVRLAATNAVGGVSTHTFGNGAMAGSGTKNYQLWFRSTPSTYCDAMAAFNLSNGRSLTW